MKQATFVIECVLTDNKDTILIRDARNGQVLKVCDNMNEVASFLSEVIDSVKNAHSNPSANNE